MVIPSLLPEVGYYIHFRFPELLPHDNWLKLYLRCVWKLRDVPCSQFGLCEIKLLLHGVFWSNSGISHDMLFMISPERQKAESCTRPIHSQFHWYRTYQINRKGVGWVLWDDSSKEQFSKTTKMVAKSLIRPYVIKFFCAKPKTTIHWHSYLSFIDTRGAG